MKKIVKRFFNWVFKEELKALQTQLEASNAATKDSAEVVRNITRLLHNAGISVDVHEYPSGRSKSWAVLSLPNQRETYIKFIDLTGSDVRQIAAFLRQFEMSEKNIDIDATPMATKFIKAEIQR